MICWMFPGQPVAFADNSVDEPEFQKIALLCQNTTGFNPIDYGMSALDLSESVRLQLFGVCVSLYRFNQLKQQGITPDLIAEHSMGIYPALAASGSIDSVTALELTWRLGRCMSEMGKKYALGCVIGLHSEQVKSVAANNGVYIANYNTSRHLLLAGKEPAISSALEEAKTAGAFSVSCFACDAPLHTPLMAVIAGDLATIVADYRFQEPCVPLVEHISQTRLTAAAIPGFLVEELQRPVYWEKTWQALSAGGFSRCFEVGSGQTLTKFNRWIDSEMS